jgi:transposase InsO family protein
VQLTTLANGKVERSHRIDHEEFWSRHAFSDFDTATTALGGWEHTYNHERFSLALQGRTPAEKLATFQPPSRAA